MFDESKHPRDGNGKFKKSTQRAENIDLANKRLGKKLRRFYIIPTENSAP